MTCKRETMSKIKLYDYLEQRVIGENIMGTRYGSSRWMISVTSSALMMKEYQVKVGIQKTSPTTNMSHLLNN